MHRHTSLSFLFLSFLKIGASAFGGFMALISAVENVFVTRHDRIEHKDMLDGISLASMLPGAIAVNVVAYVGFRLRGLPGAAVSVVAVVLPSFLLLLLLANLYQRWGEIPAVTSIFSGFIPAVCAVIVATAWNLGRKTVTGWKQGLLFTGSAAALIFQGGFLVTIAVVIGSGLIGLILFKEEKASQKSVAVSTDQVQPTALKSIVPFPLLLVAGLSTNILLKLFLVFGGMSLMLFGGGYVFIPLIQQVVVDGYHWVSQREFVDAIAMGQITPGPILISAAFIGYKVAGIGGALVATIGIFLPSVTVMVYCSTVFTRLKMSAAFQSALAGIRPAIVGLVAAAVVVIARTAPVTVTSLIIFLVGLLLLLRFRAPFATVIIPAGFAGWILYQV